jgi:hypothetical protein
MSSFIILFFNKYYYDDQMENEMDGHIVKIGGLINAYEILAGVGHSVKRLGYGLDDRGSVPKGAMM